MQLIHSPADFVVVILAAWRLTNLLYEEKIFSFIRKWIGVEEVGDIVAYPNTFLGNLFSCFWCLSVWCGAVILAVYLFVPYSEYVLYILFLSATSIIIKEILLGS